MAEDRTTGSTEVPDEQPSSPAVAAPDDAAPQADVEEGADTAPPAPAPAAPARDYSWVLGLGFWLVLGAFFVYRAMHVDRATMLLNVTSTEPLHISGAVTHNGQAVSDGTVQLTVMEALERRYLSSETLTVEAGGRFSTDPAKPLATNATTQKLKISASFFGRTPAAEPKDQKPLVADETLYVNFTPMFGPVARWIAGGLAVPFVLLIFLFTGPLTKAKARVLFMVTYAVTLFSCLIPIALTFWVSRNPYLVEVMEATPVGLLKGTGKGIESPQWLVNIGGAVVPAHPLAGGSDATKSTTPVDSTGGAPASATDELASADAQVKGGLVIPLFVIMLATLGAGINMTRKVPEIQKSYDSVAITLGDAMRAPVAVFSQAGERVAEADAATIRKDLIETYMYFLSAPFLAIAVYYLLQVIATSVAEPVLVVIAFATGLMSNTVIGSIIAFADATLKKTQGQQAAQSAERAG